MMTKKKQWIIAGLLVSGLFLASGDLVVNLLPAHPAQAQGGASIECSFIGAGIESGSSGNVSIEGSLGQWAVGGGTNGTTELVSSIWGCGAGGGPGGGPGSSEPVFLPLVLK